VLFLDINMTGIDGYETARQVLEIYAENKARPPHIFGLTGDNSESVKQMAECSGMERVLVKPIGKDSLEKVLLDIID